MTSKHNKEVKIDIDIWFVQSRYNCLQIWKRIVNKIATLKFALHIMHITYKSVLYIYSNIQKNYIFA